MAVSYTHLDVYKRQDYVSVHIPATPENIKSISNHEFQIMKPTAVLINAARGKIVDETALERAIRNKEIAGAGLDVSDPEPAVPDNPLFHMDEVIMTPHCAGTTHEAMAVSYTHLDVYKRQCSYWSPL